MVRSQGFISPRNRQRDKYHIFQGHFATHAAIGMQMKDELGEK
jgi:hypothetical protein